MASPTVLDVMATSIIQLTPASQAFVDMRATTLGPWVIGGSLDCILLGVVFCQVQHFIHNWQTNKRKIRAYETYLVCVASFLSVLKTIQVIAIVWEQNVMMFSNPDKARLLANSAWWQVSAPLMTGITGFVVQSFFAYRFLKLTGNWWYFILIISAMVLGISGGCVSTFYIVKNITHKKITWLLIHLVCVSISDILITVGTVFALYRRNSGLSSTTSLIKRLLRLVFEAAIPPAFVATVDVILTQTLKENLLWHLVLNYSLEKLYVISLLYTLNSIGDYRTEYTTNGKLSFGNIMHLNRRGDVEMGSHLTDEIEIQISTQMTTHLSPPVDKKMQTESEDRITGDDESVSYIPFSEAI